MLYLSPINSLYSATYVITVLVKIDLEIVSSYVIELDCILE